MGFGTRKYQLGNVTLYDVMRAWERYPMGFGTLEYRLGNVTHIWAWEPVRSSNV